MIKFYQIKKLLNSNNPIEAVEEIIKYSETDFEAVLPLFSSEHIALIDSNVLVKFINKMFILLKKSFKDAYIHLFYELLSEIEVNELNVDNLQSLSLILRYLGDIPELSSEKCYSLICLIEFLKRRIKKRAKLIIE